MMEHSNNWETPALPSPVIILVDPQLGENIGTAARAMLNFGVSELRLVRPRDGWPNNNAIASAAGADEVLSNVKLFNSTEEAISDLHTVYASTGRVRDMIKRVVSPEYAANNMRVTGENGKLSGILFGPERSGLENSDLALSDAIIEIPANDQFRSLNLAMAVLVVCYEWSRSKDIVPANILVMGNTRSATKTELQGLFTHLEHALDDCGFLRVKEKRPRMIQNIRNIFQRSELTEQEVRTLRGVISGLARQPSKLS